MPVVITPDPLTKESGKCRDQLESSPSQLLRSASQSDSEYPILRSSVSFPDGGSGVAPAQNGFTHTVIRAWQQDLHLQLRPDDVWLSKVLEYMMASFDRPDDADVRQFWDSAVHQAGGGSSGGLTTLSGWLTAFCWWRVDGERFIDYADEDLARAGFWGAKTGGCRRLVLDGVEFPVIDSESIPAGVVRVPLTLYQPWGEEEAMLFAGSMGMEVMIEDDHETAVRPASGWWMLETL